MRGTRFYYEEAGTAGGRPLLLLHASLQTAESMAPLRNLPCLQPFRQVIPDQRGHGRTANPGRTLSIGQMADDMAEVMTHLHLDRPVVAGYSLGGTVGIELAARGLLSGLIVLASRITTAPRGRKAFDPDDIRRRSPQWAQQLTLKHEETPWEELAATLGAVFEEFPGFATERLAAIRCPVLVTQGDKDHMVPLTDARTLAATVPDGELKVVPRSDHPELLYRKDALAGVCDFVARKLAPND